MAADNNMGDQDVFPKNRFALELIDVLLDEPCVFPLTEPVVTIGLSGAGNSWNLPLDRMGLDPAMLWGEAEWFEKSLLTIEFCPETGTWKISQTNRLDLGQDGEMESWDAAFAQLEPGLTRLEVWLPHKWTADGCDSTCPGVLGIFTLLLHDSTKPPSTFSQKLASLPEVPLGIIGSELHPMHYIRHLCSFSQAVASKLPTRVQWPGLRFLYTEATGSVAMARMSSFPRITNFLDCLRVAKLLRNSNCPKELFLGRETCQLQKTCTKNILFNMVKKFVFAPELEHLRIDACWLSCLLDAAVPLPRSLRTMYVEYKGGASLDACNQLWRGISELKLLPSTEVTVHFIDLDDPSGSGDDSMIDWAVPNVTKVYFEYWEENFLPQTGLTNLKELHLSMSEWYCYTDGEYLSSGYHSLSQHLEASSYPLLTEVTLGYITADAVRPVLEGLATAAPNLEVLELFSTQVVDGDALVRPTGPTMAHFRSFAQYVRKFVKLRNFKFTGSFERWPVGLVTVLNFCLAMRSTVSVVEFESVLCDDIGYGEEIKNVSLSLENRGKRVILSKLHADLKQLCFPADSFQGVSCIQFKVVVRDAE